MKRVGQTTIKRVIKYWLKQTPSRSFNDFPEVKHIILDGTFLKRPRGIYAAMDSETHNLLYAAVNVRESANDLLNFYSQLSEARLYSESATTDGNAAQMKQLKNL